MWDGLSLTIHFRSKKLLASLFYQKEHKQNSSIMGERAAFTDKFSSYTMLQLNELLENDEKLIKIVTEMDEMLEVQQSKEMTLASNRSLAELNLMLQPDLDHQKNQLTKHYRHLQELYEAYQLRKSTLDHNSGNSSLDTLLALLQTEGAMIEEETENMADCFLDGELPLDSFIDDYQSKRKLAHLRRVKIDKLREVVLKGPPTLAQSSATHTPTQPLPQEPTSPSPFLGYTNGSPILLPSRHQPTPPPAQSGPLPYPLAPYPMPGPMPSYPSPMFQQYPPALPQRPTPGLPPRTGFMMQ
ncbi:VPS37B subunit of ESCRT-I b [Clupea harengus]|uniref:VPS37B subunit of ESCRT-I b n=1 Tax=Clupea harengus TaxID=7950 RepID=A0A6P3VF08_CLUHA|nr:VPS37B subunit of ESCRT-I b [Clupea harengus]